MSFKTFLVIIDANCNVTDPNFDVTEVNLDATNANLYAHCDVTDAN